MTNTSKWVNEIARIGNNPAAIQALIIDDLESMTSGTVRLIDPTNPVVLTLEAGTAAAAAGMMQAESLARRNYPSLAQTEEDLYYHMSDEDYAGRWASPSRTKFLLIFKLDEIKRLAVNIPNTEIRKTTIPRHTEVTVADIQFTMQYPIDIRIMKHGGLSITYDVDNISPIQTLSTNSVEWTISRLNSAIDDYLLLTIPMQQFKIRTIKDNLNSAMGFRKSYEFVDNFYHCRAFSSDGLGGWDEIRTTHTDQVYDPLVPTAVLRVVSNILQVHIPQIYFNNNLLTDTIRIDIYSTRGKLDMQLSNYAANAFSVRWLDNDNSDNGIYSAPLSIISHGCASSYTVTGGKGKMDFESLRKRVMNNATGAANLPITPNQLYANLDNMGYEVVLDSDSILERVYLAARLLPTPTLENMITPANSAIQMFESNIEDLIGLDTTNWNGSNRLTLYPNTLYKNVNGVVKIVPYQVVQNMLSLTPEALVENLNANNYIYSPFYYTLDITGNTFNLRPYHLSTPEISSKFFMADNESAAMEVSIDSYQITYNNDGSGYTLDVVTKSGDAFKQLDHANGQVQLQASFIPPNSTNRAVLTGTDITDPSGTGERVYRFVITTDFDITAQHHLNVNAFHMFDTTARIVPMELDLALDVIFVILDYTPAGLGLTSIDELVQTYELPSYTTFTGVTHERLDITLGDHLEGLWHRARSVTGPEEYAKYANDIMAYYEADVFETDLAGNIVMGWDEVNNEITYNKIHDVGDPVMVGGIHQIKHAAGSVILDSDGNPTLVGGASNRGMLRQSDMFFIDGRFYFVTDNATIEYKETLPSYIRDWVVEDIAGIEENMLESTELYLYPRSTVGKIHVITGEDTRTLIDAAQSFTVRFHVNAEVYKNSALRKSMELQSKEVISAQLNQTTIAISQMERNIHAVLGNNIASVELYGLGNSDIKAMTVIDRSVKPSIGKRAIVLADQSITVEDAVKFEFVKHGV